MPLGCGDHRGGWRFLVLREHSGCRNVAGAGLKSGSERQADLRARRREAGLQPKEIWVHPKDWPVVKQLLERLAKRRNAK